MTYWYPRDGKLRKDLKRWEDNLHEKLGPLWTRRALDKSQSKKLKEAFANRHMDIRDII